MKKINYISVATRTDNSGDEYIEKCFLKEFSDYEFNLIVGNHESLQSDININIGDIVMSSSNMLKVRDEKLKNIGPWRWKGYKYNNIIPISIGKGQSVAKPWDLTILQQIPNYLFIVKIPIVFLAHTIGRMIEAIYNKAFYNKRNAKKAIKKALSKEGPISCRTQEAQDYLKSLGFNNTHLTCCVTLWGFDDKAIASINNTKKENLIIAFTRESLEIKNAVVQNFKKMYKQVIVWHQNYNWEEEVNADLVIQNDWDKLGELYSSGNYDYIGSRLHAGVFAMKSGVRSLFISVDNRVVDFSKLIGIKQFHHKKWLEVSTDKSLIMSNWSSELKPVDQNKIIEYKTKLDEYLFKK